MMRRALFPDGEFHQHNPPPRKFFSFTSRFAVPGRTLSVSRQYGRLVQHVELFRSVFSSVKKYGVFSARVIRQKSVTL